jgi:hypothetical protein
MAAAGLDPKTTFVAYDKEHNPDGPTVTMDHVRQFAQTFFDATGRWPAYYSNTSDLKDDIAPDDILRNCLLWVAAYGNYVEGINTPWPWSIWQYQGAGSGTNERPHDASLYPETWDGVGKVDGNIALCKPEELVTYVLGRLAD